ncbi:MAG: acetate--CoA ligase family protein [Desulfobacterales bacterium]|nr:acetate--CoA ligase family protein [Desulfobacterales bacterium]
MKSKLAQWRSRLRRVDRPDEYESKRLLASLGLNVPEGLRSASGPLDQPPPFKGPYALKVCSPDVMHKSDVRGVCLNLDRDALDAAMHDLAIAFPVAPLLVEQMVESTGPEIIAGGLMDPSLGPAVMVGTGGILTEITPDVAFRLAPLDTHEAHRMLKELRIHPVFEGYRGLNLDAAGLVRLLVTVSRMIAAWDMCFDQLDLNPIVWTGREWVILDAKLVLRTAA